MSYSFHLQPVAERCPLGHATLHHISGRDRASAEYLDGWRFWCSTCQSATMTQAEALDALANAGGNGVVVSAHLTLALTEWTAEAEARRLA